MGWVFSITPRSLYPEGKSPRYLLDRRLGGPQSRSWRGGKEKNSYHFRCRESNLVRPARSQVLEGKESVICFATVIQLALLWQYMLTLYCCWNRKLWANSREPIVEHRTKEETERDVWKCQGEAECMRREATDTAEDVLLGKTTITRCMLHTRCHPSASDVDNICHMILSSSPAWGNGSSYRRWNSPRYPVLCLFLLSYK
jgi:hypothetical protein